MTPLSDGRSISIGGCAICSTLTTGGADPHVVMARTCSSRLCAICRLNAAAMQFEFGVAFDLYRAIPGAVLCIKPYCKAMLPAADLWKLVDGWTHHNPHDLVRRRRVDLLLIEPFFGNYRSGVTAAAY